MGSECTSGTAAAAGQSDQWRIQGRAERAAALPFVCGPSLLGVRKHI
jgi:hypothetical protein